jgi:hypothetical protein
MHKVMLFLAMFGLAGALWAADPIVGTWKLNMAKSKFLSTDSVSKEQTLVIRAAGTDQYEMAITGIQADGQPMSAKAVHPQQGGVVSGLSLPEGYMVVQTVIAPGNVCTTFLQNGKQVRMHHNIVSKDGKTMTQAVRSLDAKGQPVDALSYWEKQ